MIVTTAYKNYVNHLRDLSFGSGVHLFGHTPKFVLETLKKESLNSITTQHETQNTVKFKELLSEMTEFEQFLICNTGAEAVQKAIRMARSNKKTKKLGVFKEAWHGMVDDTLEDFKESISQHDTVFLERTIEGLKVLDSSFCAVIVEPIPQKNPNFDLAFLHKLSEKCKKEGITLISDEIISGFRLNYTFDSDIKIYGKALSSGVPIGVIAYKNIKEPFPKGGTYSGNNLSVSVALATLQQLNGNDSTILDKLGDLLRDVLNKYEVPNKGYGSMTRVYNYTDVMVSELRKKKILYPKNSIIYNAFTESEKEVEAYGIFIGETYKKFNN